MVSVAHSGQCLQNEVYGEYVHALKVIFVKAVEVHPGELLIFREVIVQAAQKAPEAREKVRGEEHKDKERYQINIVSDLHNIIAPCD